MVDKRATGSGTLGKEKAPKPKGVKKVATHSNSQAMVLEAVTNLAEKEGSSLHAIKKSIAETHDVDMEKQGPFINKALKKLVEMGKLIQLTGKGAAGSFKLAAKPGQAKKAVEEKKSEVANKSAGSPNKAKKPTAAKPTKEKAPSKPKAAASPKKAAASKEKPTANLTKPVETPKKKAKVRRRYRPGTFALGCIMRY